MVSTILMCLALNIYFEARNQSFEGQIAVTHVVFNRVADPQFPDNVCDVIYQARTYESGFPKRHQCQFSWYCDGKSDEPREQAAFLKAMRVIRYMIIFDIDDVTDGATHYHATSVFPDWAKSKKKTVQIGDHIFYR